MKALVGTVVVLLVVGCSAIGPGGPTSSASPPPTSAPPTADEPPLPAPPSASLTAAGSAPVEGKLGTVCYLGLCGDGPWLPAAGLSTVALDSATSEATVVIEDGFKFERWSATYAAAQDTTGSQVRPLASGGAENGPPLTEASFAAPPSGDWVVSVFLVYVNDDGDGTYYWHVTVP